VGQKRGDGRARSTMRSAALLATAAIVPSIMAPAAHAQAAGERAFDIPAQPLADALVTFGIQSGMQVTTNGVPLRGVQTGGVRGSLPPTQALSQLLAGTGFTFRISGNVVTLEPAPQSADGAIRLGPVRVEGADQARTPISSSDFAATERTGSYTGTTTTTASRMPLTVQETPQSVTIVTRQRMDDFQLQTVDSVLVNTVGISQSQAESERRTFTSRGFSITNVQVDGIASPYAASASSANISAQLDTFLYDRIEVVRGATGLLSATGDPSATINLIRKRPGRTFAVEATASAGSWDNYRAGLDLTVPIANDGGIRARIIGLYQERDSFRVRYHDQKLLLSALVEADLTPTTLLTIGNDWQKSNSDGSSYGASPRYYSDGTPLDMPRSSNLSTEFSHWNKRENRTYARIEQGLGGDWQLKVGYSYAHLLSDPRVYFLGSGIPDRAGNGRGFFSLHADGKKTQHSYDAYVNGTFELFGRRHNAMFGVNGYRRTTREDYGGVAPITGFDTNIFTFTGVGPEPAFTGRTQFFRDDEKLDGAFASLRFSIFEPLHVIVGTRVSDWRIRQRIDQPAPALDSDTGYDTGKVWTPFYGATFDVTRNITVYASYTNLFTPQNFKDVNNQIIPPIRGRNLEGGVKLSLLDDKLTINGAIYEAKRDNLAQLVEPEVILPDGGYAYESLGKGNKTKGWEVEASGAITDRWNIYAAYARNRTWTSAGVLTNTTSPEETIKFQTTWRPPVLGDRLLIGGSANWQSRAYGNVNVAGVGSIVVAQEGYALVGLLARYEITDRISMSANVNNLFDKAYYLSATGGYYGEPRNWLLTLNASF